uniref:Uncharacterized protein n=1 Tax=Anguilla anguilla TaxID=7936 RepID=A0A0E9T8H6_ANGAN
MTCCHVSLVCDLSGTCVIECGLSPCLLS